MVNIHSFSQMFVVRFSHALRFATQYGVEVRIAFVSKVI